MLAFRLVMVVEATSLDVDLRTFVSKDVLELRHGLIGYLVAERWMMF